MRHLSMAALVVALFAMPACMGSPGGALPETPPSKASADHPPGALPEAAPAFGMVDVPASGKAFDPPVHVDQIPDGAHYCDMGDVHYARMDKGDNTCPVCGMELSVKQAKAAE